METITNEPLNNTEEATEPLSIVSEASVSEASVSEASVSEARKEYMRKYMKERYEREGDKARAYSKSLKAKAKHNLTKEEFKIYGMYLSDVFKIKELFKKLPSEIQTKCLTEIQIH